MRLACGDTVLLNGDSFSVLRLLGRGKGGYSYLVEKGGRRYVLKQIHHEPCDYYTFGDKLQSELTDYDRLRAAGIPVPELLAVDREHERILKEYIHGPTVMELLKRGEPVAAYVPMVRALADRARTHGLNIDYFPTNFVPSDGTLWYIDYECNAYLPEWDFEHWGVKYWSRTPELEACWNEERQDQAQ